MKKAGKTFLTVYCSALPNSMIVAFYFALRISIMTA